MELSLASRLTLNNGVPIPQLGLGVYRTAPGLETVSAVRFALEAGYRHIDTARIYGNERDVGTAVRESGLRREELFVTTKLWNADQGYERALRACRESLQQLGLEYIDLYLIHWPVERLRLESWRALALLQRDGLCRSVGVSNFTRSHLAELIAHGPAPQVNQIELSPFLQQRELRADCAAHQIVIEAYSPLTRGLRLEHPALTPVARRHRKSVAQLLVRWTLEQGAVALPRSSRRAHILENAAVFDFALTAEDHRALAALEENLHAGWDPSAVP